MNFSDIKLIIWDLDDTLWNGVLSEGPVSIKQGIINLLNNIVDSGVMISICSKNDRDAVLRKLAEYNIDDLFVFVSIDWSPKGKRVKQIVENMNFRPINVLFVDDNYINLEEAKSYLPTINVANEKIIISLMNYYLVNNKKDVEHKRLNEYKLLEEKLIFKASSGDNLDFLKKCNIKCDILYDCENNIDRIHELIQRTNQLNFTKNRMQFVDLKNLLLDDSVTTAYIKVKDRFGDYGIVGFVAIKNNSCIHFLFSCRVMNMGVEQYTYVFFNRPTLLVLGEVASDVNNPNPFWINSTGNDLGTKKRTLKPYILLKGPCDLSQIFAYLKEDKHFVTEFTYMKNNGVAIESINHSIHMLESTENPSKNSLFTTIFSLPISDKNMFSNECFNKKYSYVFFSVLQEAGMGIYEDKKTGKKFAFGSYAYDLTNNNMWEAYLNKDKSVFISFASLTLEELRFIKEHFLFKGRLSPEQSFENLKQIYYLMPETTTLVFVLGSETPYLGECTEEWKDRHLYHKELNTLLRDFATRSQRIKIIDVNKYIANQDSFNGVINHYSRNIYYRMANDIAEIANTKRISLLSYFLHIVKQFFKTVSIRTYRFAKRLIKTNS